MQFFRNTTFAIVLAVAAMLVPAAAATAAATTATFAGTITSTMTVNNGTNTGSIPAGTPYTGTLTFDSAQTPTPQAYGGGTHTVYAFDNLAFTVGSSTANSGPGRIDVYDNLTSSTGYPNGDSLYVNFAGVAPSGLLAGAAFNWMGLALLDPAGAAITDGRIPAGLGTAGFPTHFSEFNFGTRGTAWGAGNTSMIQGLASLTTSGGIPAPSPVSFTPTLPGGTAGVPYSQTFGPATGGSGSFTYSAAGLPSGLSLNGTTVSGTPASTGTFNVTLTATDTGSGATTSAAVPLTIADQAITFAPALPAGTVGSAYATGLSATGFGPFTYSAQGLPSGLTLSGDQISGTPTTAGTFTVALTATDAAGATKTAQVPLTVAAGSTGGSYTVSDENKGKITAIAPDGSFLMVGTKKLIWDGSTRIIVNTPDGERHVIDGFVTVGMRVQWKGLRDKATNTVLTSQIEVN